MKDQATGVKICQSCGMPMVKISDYGTLAGRKRSKKYCRFCLRNGEFTDAEIDMNQMINKTAVIMARKMRLAEGEARRIAEVMIPFLARWKKI